MRARFFGLGNPWFQIFFGALLVTVSELFLKHGATVTAHVSPRFAWTGLTGLGSPWIWWGIFFVILSFLSWLYVLKHVPLSIAFPLSNVVHIFVPLASWIFLGELISPQRWCGITLVLIGVLVVARPVAQIEERL